MNLRMTPLAWVSIGLVCLTIGVILAGDTLVDLVPDRDRLVYEYRRNVAESLAVQYSALAEEDRVEIIKHSMNTFAMRNPTVQTMRLLRQDGTILAQVGDQHGAWGQPSGDGSTLEFVQVPIFSGEDRWGVLQVAFQQEVKLSGFQWFLNDPWVRFLTFVGCMGFIGYLTFMKRTLKQLDPSGIVPARVQAALDALTQGVVMIDTRDFIVLANDTFCRAVGKSVKSLIGHDLGTFAWKPSTPSTEPLVHPWTTAIMAKQHLENAPLLLELSASETRKFIVNTVPIMDDGSTVRGALVSFQDVTELDRMNTQLTDANSELEQSRAQVLEKNQELEKTNVNLSVEITERKKAEAEREKLHQQLLKASRQAGMADVASSVLHNVGNVLNSINISTDTLIKTLKKPMVGDVCRIASMFHEHQHDLQEFLTADPKGKQIPGYLSLVAESLSGSHKTIQGELDTLMKKVDHIKQVILSQQDIARAGTVREAVTAEELMEQALMMAMPEPDKYRIEIVKEYSHVPKFMTDRHQVLQILVNLVTNAKNAMVEHPGHSHRLTLRLGVATGGKNAVRLEVSDTGCGIAAENLSRLFTQGFTTRKAGHGLGLHSAAIAAKCVGGSIRANSAGEGTGATFTLDLPLNLAEAAA